MTEQNRLWTFKEVQERLAISQPTLHRLIAEKEIGAFRIGQQWRFSEKQVQEYLEKNRHVAESDEN